MDRAGGHAGLHLAVGLMQVRAVIEAAELRRRQELREVVAERITIEIPEPELADAGRVDDERTPAEVVERGGRRRVAARTAFGVQAAGGDLQALIEGIEDGRLPDPAVADQRAGLSLQEVAQGIETLAALRRAADDGHAQAGERLERGELSFALVGRNEVDLVHADGGLRATAEDGDEEAVDEPRPERRRLQRDDVNYHVDVRRDEALQMRVERIGTRQHRVPREDGSDPPVAAVGYLDHHAVADGENAFLARGDLGRKETVLLHAVMKDTAASTADVDDDGRAGPVAFRGGELAEVAVQQVVERPARRRPPAQTRVHRRDVVRQLPPGRGHVT